MPAITPKTSSPEVSRSLQYLEQQFLDGELTKKGYCRMKWSILQDHADSSTAFLVNTLKQRPFTENFTEADLYDAMLPLLEMVADKVTAQQNHPSGDSKTNGNGTSQHPDPPSKAHSAEGNGSGELKQDERSPSETGETAETESSAPAENMEVDTPPAKTTVVRTKSKVIRDKPGPLSSKIKRVSPEGSSLSAKPSTEDDGKSDWPVESQTKSPVSSSSGLVKRNPPGINTDSPAGPSGLKSTNLNTSTGSNGEPDKSLSPCRVLLKKRKTRLDDEGYLVVDDSAPSEPSSSTKKIKLELDSDATEEKESSKAKQDKRPSVSNKGVFDSEDPEEKKPRRRTRVKLEVDSDGEDSDEKKPARRRSKPGKILKVKGEKEDGLERCRICRQILDSPDLRLFEGHPNMAVEEVIALFADQLTEAYGGDEMPQNKLTQFSVYDEEGHLCTLDGGVLERDQKLFASGYLKPVYEEDPSAEDAVPTKEIGPITQWWIGGYDGGEKALIGISSGYGDYFLMEPAESYAPYMTVLLEKIYLGKLVIEFLINEEEASYEDLLNHIQTSVPPPGIQKITEDLLIRHAQFVCDQVVSYDEAGYSSEEDDEVEWRLLTAAPCMRTLKSLAGATTKKRGYRVSEKTKTPKPPKPKDGVTMATTTALVRDIFDSLFSGQLAVDEKKLQGRKKLRCGVCEACQKPDCGSCTNCKDMLKFGGTGKSKQSCIKRKCPNMSEKEAAIESDDDEDDDVDDVASEAKTKSKSREFLTTKKKVEWVGEPIHIDENGKKYYSTSKVGQEEITVGDFVSCQAAEKNAPVVIGRVQFLWENATHFNKKYMHLYWFSRGCETILGETANPQELFLVDECEDTHLNGVISKVNVHKKEISDTWADDGGKEGYDQQTSYGPTDFFYSKKYDTLRGRFETIPPPEDPDDEWSHRHCPACIAAKKLKAFQTPYLSEPIDENEDQTEFAVLTWRGETYFKGQCVYLEPGAFRFKKNYRASKFSRKEDEDEDGERSKRTSFDEEKYPEKYRKNDENRRPTNKDNPDPFCIGLIQGIFASSSGLVDAKDVTIRVFKFYRPENTRGLVSDLRHLDLTKLYASVEDDVSIDFSRVVGKCYVVYDNHFPNTAEATSWSTDGPDRFYFSDAYDPDEQKTVDPPRVYSSLGYIGKGVGKGTKKSSRHTVTIPSFPSIDRPLNCLDVFAGCGGLSDGLHQAGVAESKWAIEKIDEAASAFRINNPGTTVFTDDCNNFLKAVMNGETKNNKGQKYPQKGEVEMLVGGPPCQGFSGMNRFNWRETAMFRNSLVVSYLSFCDYYRPKYFILENVRNFVSFKKSMVLKLTLRCLVQMGYQVAVGILQAGHYGVPQTRRRAIILAAAPGETLPQYPEPLHVFNPKTGGLSIAVDEKKIVSGCRYTESAPLRTITVYDAMSDLPEIKNGDHKVDRPYGEPETLTHFQKMVRDKTAGAMLRDHICKDFSALVVERIKNIPTTKNADWRDLPNIEVTLPDGTVCRKLIYTHVDKKNGNSPKGALRGVCSCATGGKCDPIDRQFNTVIPWCLPHTGNRHNNWAGLYGRLQWGEFFSTTVTNPEPMGKQGRVLHPSQDRCVSVRECARSQGFRDAYRFYGTTLDKHRQVGNAVPPPMGRAIGLEIRKCLASKKKNEGDSQP